MGRYLDWLVIKGIRMGKVERRESERRGVVKWV